MIQFTKKDAGYTLIFLICMGLGIVAIYTLQGEAASQTRHTAQEGIPVVPTTSLSPTQTNHPIKAFTLHISDTEFSPKTITVATGDRVQLTVLVDEGLHNLIIDYYRIATPAIQTGDTKRIEFVATTSGRFPYYSHTGMYKNEPKGTLIVE